MNTEERLEKLERELARAKRRNRWVLAAVGLGALAWTVMGAARVPTPPLELGPGVSQVIRANRFELKETNGRTRAILDMGKEGPSLCLFDEKGKIRVELYVRRNKADAPEAVLRNPGVPGLRLWDEDGMVRALLGAGALRAPDGTTASYTESSLVLLSPEGVWQAP